MSNRTASFYNTFSIFYPVVDLFLKPQKRVLLREINKLPEGRLLEIGVGNGAHLLLYRKHEVIGIDTSSEMLDAASRRENVNAKLINMNGEDLLFPDESFDYVVISHVLAVVESPEQLLDEVYRVVKPNGRVFILNHFTPDNWLKYVDRAFGIVSKRFHFRSVFYLSDIQSFQKFSLLKEFSFAAFSYFKLLIFQKK